MRWLRLLLGFGFLLAFGRQNDWFLLFISSYFLIQAIFNIGCSGNSCAIPENDKTAETAEQIRKF